MTDAYGELERCLVSESKTLVRLLDSGEQSLNGVFPHSPDEGVTVGPLRD